MVTEAFVACGLDTPCRLGLLGAVENSGRSKLSELLLRLVDSDNRELREAALMAFKRIDVVYEKKVSTYVNLRL